MGPFGLWLVDCGAMVIEARAVTRDAVGWLSSVKTFFNVPAQPGELLKFAEGP
jgi:hypothetical protein